jgi:hypothetical protein
LIYVEQAMEMRHMKTVTFSDNTPAVAWVSKMHTKAGSDISSNLLRGIAMCQLTTVLVMPEVRHIEQEFNVPADVASRRSITGKTQPAYINEPSTGLANVKDCYFLSYFNSRDWVRTGHFRRGKQVQQQSVEKALHHVGQALVLPGFPDPRRSYGAKELDLAFRHTLKSLKEADPVPKPQLALLPVETITAAAAPAHYLTATRQ